MKNHIKRKIFKANIYLVCLLAVISMTAISETTMAKSLYVMTKTAPRLQSIQAYDIGIDGTLTFQTETPIPYRMLGSARMAVDSDSGYLFVTYAYIDEILLIEAEKMVSKGLEGFITIPYVRNPASTVYDHDKGLLYCVDHGTSQLYVHSWDPTNRILSHIGNKTLKNATAYGIALDEIDDILYVANGTNEIYAYDTSSWSLERTITLTRIATSIAVDVKNGYLYTGSFTDNRYLTQFHLSSNTEIDEVQVGPNAGVKGLSVDPDTGFVYLSTVNDTATGGDNILVYDETLNNIDVIKGILNSTCLTIPGKNIGYNPLNLSKVASQGVDSNIEIGNIKYEDGDSFITYNICFDNTGNNFTLNNLTIVDTLPDNVTFISAEDDGEFGYYNPDTHTYTWVYPVIMTGATACLDLTVKVEDYVAPGSIIANSVTINSNETPPTTKRCDIIKTTNPINIRKSVRGASDGVVMQVDPGQTITYRTYFNNNDNDFTATGVTIVDKLPKEVSFVSADFDSSFGQYDPNTHTYTWLYPPLEPMTATYLDITARVNPDILPGTLISNVVTVNSEQTPSNTSSVDVMTTINLLNLSKTVVDTFFDGRSYRIGADETLTYQICFQSKEGTYPFTEVTITDKLPNEVSFVSADGDGIIGLYDDEMHTYTWSYPSVQPGTVTRIELTVKVNDVNEVPLGTIITNSVTLESNETPTTTASIDVITWESPLKIAELQFIPNVLRRYNGIMSEITAVIQLPNHYIESDINKDVMAILTSKTYPVNIIASVQEVISTDQGPKVVAVFNKAQLLNALPGYGRFKLTVIGKLQKSDRYFSGEQEIWIASSVGF